MGRGMEEEVKDKRESSTESSRATHSCLVENGHVYTSLVFTATAVQLKDRSLTFV